MLRGEHKPLLGLSTGGGVAERLSGEHEATEWGMRADRQSPPIMQHNGASSNSPPLTLHDDATPPGTARASHTWTSNWSGKRERLHAHAVPGRNEHRGRRRANRVSASGETREAPCACLCMLGGTHGEGRRRADIKVWASGRRLLHVMGHCFTHSPLPMLAFETWGKAESPAAPAPTTRTRRRLASVLIRFCASSLISGGVVQSHPKTCGPEQQLLPVEKPSHSPDLPDRGMI